MAVFGGLFLEVFRNLGVGIFGAKRFIIPDNPLSCGQESINAFEIGL